MNAVLTSVENAPTDVDVIGLPLTTDLAIPTAYADAVSADDLASMGFEGKPGQSGRVRRSGAADIVLLGLGPADEVTPSVVRQAVGALIRAAWRDRAVGFVGHELVNAGDGHLSQVIAEGVALGSYRFTKYQTDAKPCKIERVVVVGANADGMGRGEKIGGAVCLARDLINEPAGAMTPRKLAEVATGVAEREGLAISVLDENAIEQERLGGLRGVSMGSMEPPRLIELTYEPDAPTATVALVGKGITFDSGGLSLKPADGMMTMKTDMSGAAAVLAVMSVLPALAPNVKVIGIMPTTENMPGNRATKPGDVLRIRNGKTIEVLNTDAEGRLVLADGLSLAVEAGADAIVDVATLTGACVVALGKEISGLMGNNDGWLDQVSAASETAGEPTWKLPLPKQYRKNIDSEIADMKNIGDNGAGASTAGLLLQEFVGDTPWAHIDIAGPARVDKEVDLFAKGGTGVGVRTMISLIENLQPIS